jgi:aromatic-L-amino-acid decarboxylase
MLDGTWSVRVSIGAERTERQDVEELWRLLKQAVLRSMGGELR